MLSRPFGGIAQLVEQPAHTRYVPGSNPGTATSRLEPASMGPRPAGPSRSSQAPCTATPATVAVTEITVGQETNADGRNPKVPAPINGGDKLVAMVLTPSVTTSPSKVMGTAVATCWKVISPVRVALCEVTTPLTLNSPPLTVKVPLPPPVRLGVTPIGGVQLAPYLKF